MSRQVAPEVLNGTLQMLGRAVRTKRLQQHFSLRQLSRHLQIAFSTLGRLENARGGFDTHTRLKVSAWLMDTEPLPCPCVRCHPENRQGWQCPGCARCYGPHINQCPFCGEQHAPAIDRAV